MTNIKEAYRLFWMVKGHLDVTEETALASADSYFNRLWGNHEACFHEEGFEEAWQKKIEKES